MRSCTITLFLLAAACVKQVPIEIDLVAVGPSLQEGTLVPRSIDLMHQDQGWVHIDLPAQAIGGSERFDSGTTVSLATTDLPTGRYEAIRFSYTSEATAPAAGTVAPGEPVHEPQKATEIPEERVIRQLFCIDADDTEIVLEVSRIHPSLGGTPQVSLRAPGC